MDKFKTIGVGGLPHTLNDFRQFLGRLDAPSEGIYQAFNNLLRGFGDNFIVQGVVASGTTPNVAITEGWVLLDGELIKVDAQTGINTTTNNKFVKVTTFDSRGTKTFLNGSINETYKKNRAVVQGTAGNLAFNGNTFFDLSNQANSLPDTGIKILNKKVIEIGDWNMDTTSSLNVTHGIDHTKIRMITVIIQDDNSIAIIPLNEGGSETNTAPNGAINIIISSFITLKRLTGGVFDNTSYDSTPFNRGWITIEFES